MVRDKAEKQKQKAKEMLGISDERASEIFEEQPDRKQQKKKEMESKGASEDEEDSYECPECGDQFDSKQGMKVHKGQQH